MARSDRNGKRKSRDSLPRHTPKLGYFIIVTDADSTEPSYFVGLKDSLPKELQDQIVVKVVKTDTKNLVNKCLELASKQAQFAEPWIAFDRDRVKNFDHIITSAESQGISVAWSNPCIETWFSTYFGKMLPSQDSVSCCRAFSDLYKAKTGKEYKKSDKQIYKQLTSHGDERGAIIRAGERYNQHCKDGIVLPSKMIPCSTVYKIVAEIRGRTR